jgi:hypothetical protein
MRDTQRRQQAIKLAAVVEHQDRQAATGADEIQFGHGGLLCLAILVEIVVVTCQRDMADGSGRRACKA